MIVKW